MKSKQQSFGQHLRDKRIGQGYSLRKFAQLVGVSPTYLSQVEQGNCDPPTSARVRCMAEVLGENMDEMIAMAGRVPDDLPEIIRRLPTEIPELLREVSGLSPEQCQTLTAHARRLRRTPKKDQLPSKRR